MSCDRRVPPLALAAEDGSPRRSLILAGGGMRVAWQAGVLEALETAGLRFAHADGTSGGTINLAMLLSGVTPEEMCERWRTLDVRDFVSLLPFAGCAAAAPGFGDAAASGGSSPISASTSTRIRAARGIEGTFNVCTTQRR